MSDTLKYIQVLGMESKIWKFAGSYPFVTAVIVIIGGLVIRFFLLLYYHRRRMHGLPGPPHHPLFGHLEVLGKLQTTLPHNIHAQWFPQFLQDEYPNLGPVIYLDAWPFTDPLCFITHPDVANQATQTPSLPKHREVKRFINPIIGENNMVVLEGNEWKKWRSVFNPGFSGSHLMSLVPEIVELCLVFYDNMERHADVDDMFSLEQEATKLTFDVIGKVALDADLHAQTSENELVSAFRSQVRWIPMSGEMNPFKLYNPMRPFMYWYNARRMNRYIGNLLDERFETKRVRPTEKIKRSKPIVDLALDTYLQNHATSKKEDGKLDPTFKRFAITQIKTFMFAGHDTTSSTIAYMYHLLSKNPHALDAVRKEYDAVFGSDVSLTPQIITKTPHVLQKLHYSHAIIKETLRLFPPGPTVRTGLPGHYLEHEGQRYPTEGICILVTNMAIHRRPDLFHDPTKFIPERWLHQQEEEARDEVPERRGAWRPFETGPRQCIGQELVMIEIKIVMALTLRTLDIRSVYDELDGLLSSSHDPSSSSSSSLSGNRNKVKKVNHAGDERAYQVLAGTAKPVDGMPARVRRR